jgi:hypothetical protein
LKYQCLECSSTWIDGELTEEISHGLCRKCVRLKLTEVVHKEQLRYSGIPCYATAHDFCDQECKYQDICLESKVEEWEKEKIGFTKNKT